MEHLMNNIDSSFRMGLSHQKEGVPCQDFALHGKGIDNYSFAIVSDGCSSSERTDIGSRILSLITSKFLKSNYLNKEKLKDFILTNLSILSGPLDINLMDLDATLIVMQENKDNVKISLWGDGVIIYKGNNFFTITIIEWIGNMPGYLSYHLNPERKDLFLEESNKINSNNVHIKKITFQDHECIVDDQYLTANEALNGIDFYFDKGEYISIASDGIQQFCNIDYIDVIKDLTDFKNSKNGCFVTRRINKVLSQYKKNDIFPVDDISFATFAKED